ncbi:unnamed protein product [Vitrella brassicaformis CCMP3155]|uniref:FCP1 homology domain-containing protein n=1 Tax=Vitrella brassicaformis (strain CCMP3155) TaxID=1169540 RepID=A0A0G4FNC0_VITBC|nr:unnamed protein product [Vitrella brassicaformis CCMP3155]|eukprot:CEM15073.1 unnamed protein product [Vitrella brassicaformis CCMP3155]
MPFPADIFPHARSGLFECRHVGETADGMEVIHCVSQKSIFSSAHGGNRPVTSLHATTSGDTDEDEPEDESKPPPTTTRLPERRPIMPDPPQPYPPMPERRMRPGFVDSVDYDPNEGNYVYDWRPPPSPSPHQPSPAFPMPPDTVPFPPGMSPGGDPSYDESGYGNMLCRVYDFDPKDYEGKPKLLILSDINGTICLRPRRVLSRAHGKPKTLPRGFNGVQFLYMRPYWREYLHLLTSHPRVTFGFYTSITRWNGLNIVEFLSRRLWGLPGQPDEHWRRMMYRKISLFDFDDCVPDTEAARYPDGAVRNLRELKRVWQIYPDFNHRSTLMVDSDLRKVRRYLDNSVVPPPHLEEDLARGPNEEEDTVLLELTDYLYELLETWEGDVREYVKRNPWRLDRARTVDEATVLQELRAQRQKSGEDRFFGRDLFSSKQGRPWGYGLSSQRQMPPLSSGPVDHLSPASNSDHQGIPDHTSTPPPDKDEDSETATSRKRRFAAAGRRLEKMKDVAMPPPRRKAGAEPSGGESGGTGLPDFDSFPSPPRPDRRRREEESHAEEQEKSFTAKR